MNRILVTGGAGFIGSALIRNLVSEGVHVLNVDKLTYAGNLDSLKDVHHEQNYKFTKCDINDAGALKKLFENFKPDAVMHLAAESHVDRSISGPEEFIRTNILGTFNLLSVSKTYYDSMDAGSKKFIFHHISTDEVYGELKNDTDYFKEDTNYDPSSPYSASKASSDHLVRAWNRTFNLPVVVTNCSNNYGPYQNSEKLIPKIITNCLKEQKIPIYGSGKQIRDWLYVDDHVNALKLVVENGESGETYNIGGNNEISNINVANTICKFLNNYIPSSKRQVKDYKQLITYIDDRPGHDRRYAIDASYINSTLGWAPNETFESGISKTIQWYVDNNWWWEEKS